MWLDLGLMMGAALNVAVLVWAVKGIHRAEEMVGAAVREEVRRQDDRIEKRAQRAQGGGEDANGTAQGQGTVVAGRPLRR